MSEAHQTNDSELSAWTDGTETYVATSAETAIEMQRTYGGYAPEEQEPVEYWRRLSPEKVQSIHLDDGQGKVSKTIAEWIAESGQGPLCSTEW